MKKEIVVRKNIYTGKEHKLIWTGTGMLYDFVPAEEWMPVYLTYYNEKNMERYIQALDSDGFGSPLYVGDIIDNMKVESIMEVDDKICVLFSKL